MVWWFYVALAIANFALSRLLAPKIKAPKVGGFSFPKAEEGTVIPYVFGTVQFAPNIVWWGDVEENCGDDNLCSWWARMHAVLCWGPVDELIDLTFDGKSLKKKGKKYWGGTGGSLAGSMTPAFPIAKGAGTPTKMHVAALDMFGGEQKEGGVAGAMELAWGVPSQAILSLVAQKYGADRASGYPDLCHLTFGLASTASPGVDSAATNHFHWCNNSPYPKPIQVVLRRCPNPAGLGLGPGEENIDGDANPVAVIYELWTNSKFGCGRPTGRIDVATWQAAATTCVAEGLGVSGGEYEGRDAEEIIGDLLEHINGVIRWNPSTGLWQMKLARADYVLASLPAVTEANASGLDISWSSWQETSNEVKVFFSEHFEDTSSLGVRPAVRQYQNLANRQATGRVRPKEVHLPYLSNGAIAQLRADQYGRAWSVPLARVSWKADRRLYSVAQGDVVRVTSARYGVTDMAVRVTRVKYGSLTDNQMEFEGIQDVFGVAESSYSPPEDSVWDEPVVPPVDSPYLALVERPYAVPLGWTSEDIDLLTFLGRMAGTYSGYEVWLNTIGFPALPDNYYLSREVAAFTPVGLLTADLPFRTEDVDEVGFTVTDAAALSLLLGKNTNDAGLVSGANIALIDSLAGREFVTWRTATPNGDGTWTVTGVVRAVLDTPPPPTDHEAGATVFFFFPNQFGKATDTPLPVGLDGLPVNARFLSFNTAGTLDLDDASYTETTIHRRAASPYPAGQARLTTDVDTYARDEWPETTVGPTGLSLDWAHRSRPDQYEIIRQDEGDTGTQEGDFTLEVLVGGSAIPARTQTGLAAGPSATYTPAMRVTDAGVGAADSPVQFRVTPTNGALEGIPYTTPPVVMTGLGMTLGLYLGGLEA